MACSPLKKILDQLDRQGVKKDVATFVSLVRWCGKEKALLDGRRVHAHIRTSGCYQNTYLANLLVQMYGKCGSVEDARSVFNKTREPDLFSWTFMIAAYAQNGHEAEALQLSRHMQLRGVKPNKFTFFPILSACARLRNLTEGKWIHERIVVSGFGSDVAVMNSLVNMYGKCGSPKDARLVFDEMQERNVISWNAVIAAYAQNGQGKEAFELFRQMHMEGLKPDMITFLNILNAFASVAFLEHGRTIHEYIVATKLDSDVAVMNALVSMYGKCGSTKHALLVFKKMHKRDLISWNAMISAYAQNGQGKEAFKLFSQMNTQNITPDKITFLSMLDACARLGSLSDGRAIHDCIVASGFECDVAIMNALVNMYGKSGSPKDAWAVFGKMHKRDVISWTAMIAVCAQNGQGMEAFELFQQMHMEGAKPNNITFLNILDACVNLPSLQKGRAVHEFIVACGFKYDIAVSNALLKMYGKCGSPNDARVTFDKMHERNVISWTAMIAAYAQNGQAKEALELYQQMNMEGEMPNNVTFLTVLGACASLASLEYGRQIHERLVACGFESDVAVRTALVDMYSKCGSLKEAWAVFESMQERNVTLWTAMIAAYAQNGKGKEGLELFQQMQIDGIKPDRITFLSVLDACANLASLENGRVIHDHIVASGFESDVAVRTALVNMYGKCGSLKDARLVFDGTQERDVISWNAMIATYARNGQGKEALELCQLMDMEGIKPNKITFLSILNACSHMGLLDAGWHCFASMNGDHSITPLMEHYVCMIDLLGRAGCLDEAEDLINSMPIQPSAVAWNALLGACRIHSDVDRGTRAAKHAYELDPTNVSPYILLSNIHAATSRWNDARKVINSLEESQLKKQPGYSWIDIDGTMHDFFVGDTSLPQIRRDI